MVCADTVLAVQHTVVNTGYGQSRSGGGVRACTRGARIRQRPAAAPPRSMTVLGCELRASSVHPRRLSGEIVTVAAQSTAWAHRRRHERTRSVTAFGQRPQEECQVGRPLGQAPHEVSVPLGTKRHVYPDLVTGVGQPSLLAVTNAVQHLVFEIGGTTAGFASQTT